jgi:hypothetical protein
MNNAKNLVKAKCSQLYISRLKLLPHVTGSETEIMFILL